ncbi:unnamed protein product [Thelazia callipaeda]|uniref:Choline/ethanolamine kinase n=1 Tax=Thelazia callipaeda TaxID=103827 RepID=A0A0N5CSP9_THECL|nr:unnamed protein product [Thelazia callipaeda]
MACFPSSSFFLCSPFQELFSQSCSESKQIPYHIIAYTRDLSARYLGGAWKTIGTEQMHMRAMRGGMSNLLFLVELPSDVAVQGLEPMSALLRIHCSTDLIRHFNESIIFTMLSERLLGPQLFGVFPGGRFEQYIPSRALLCHELSYPAISRRLGVLLARIHTLNVPVSKEPMIFEVAEEWLKKLENFSSKMEHKMQIKMVQTDLSKCPEVITCDVLRNELQITRLCLEKSKSPVLFCHNDLQEGNVLLRNKYHIDQYGNLNADESEEPLVLIDFEYASYNYRGFEFANHICEYILDYANDKPPYYWIRQERAPSDKQLHILFNAYLDEYEKQTKCSNESGNERNSIPSTYVDRGAKINELITEARRFTAVSHLFWCIWSFLSAKDSPIEFDYLSYGLDRIALYYESKHKLLEYFSG